MRDPIPNLSSYKPQRRWLPDPPGGRPRDKRKPPKKRSKRRSREAAAFLRLAPGLSEAGVIIMGVAVVAVTVLVVILAMSRL
jgi:hypothetical protein